MSRKAPDTRNIMDNDFNTFNKKSDFKSEPTSKKTIIKKEVTEETVSVTNSSEISQPVQVKVVLTDSQIFKGLNGYSCSIDRAMRRNKVYDFEIYKKLRRERKVKERKQRQKKHADSVAYKRANRKSSLPKSKNRENKVAA